MSIQYTADQLQRKFQGPPGAPGFPRLAEVLRTEGRLDEAIQVCQEGLQVRPNTLSAYLVLGKALMDAGRVEEAREQFENALRLDSRCLSAMQFLARIMTRLQWADAAAGYYRSILQVEPWDAEIRALLGVAEPLSPSNGAVQSHGSSSSPYAPMAPVQPSEEDTFHKPDGLSGDVLEVNLNDMAADFLPAGDVDASASMDLVEESLEDALSATQQPFAPPAESGRKAPFVPEIQPEPRPMDVLKEESVAAEAEAETGDAPPISGQDVEDRLDSLFGVEEPPSASMRSPTSTWTAAPAEPAAPEFPSEAISPDGSATATGEMPVASGADFLGSQTTIQTGAMPPAEEISPLDLASIPDLPKTGSAESISVNDYSAVDFVTPAPGSRQEEPGEEEDTGRVQGEDIERRLDELFNLTEEEANGSASTFAASTLPVAPGPKIDEAVSMGEVVSFGGDVAYREPEARQEPQADQISGQDVADKLDNMFGAEPEAKPAVEATAAEAAGVEEDVAETMDAGDTVFGMTATQMASVETEPSETPEPVEMKPWAKDAGEPQPPPVGDIMSTESMLPPGWFGQAGDGPSITGADVEDQLDKLFNLDEGGETVKPAAAKMPPGDRVNTGDTASFRAPIDEGPRGVAPLGATPRGGTPGDESDMTVVMPAMRDPDQGRDVRAPKDAGRIKEGVADWLARQNQDADERAEDAKSSATAFNPQPGFDPGETMILPNEDADVFGTLAPEDISALSDTASIEMVDGVDVAGRLDELFAEEGAAKGSLADSEMPLFTQESAESGSVEGEAAGMVSGEDVSSRLHDMFETGAVPKSAFQEGELAEAEPDLSSATDTDETMVPSSQAPQPPVRPVPELAPMMDEEEGYPEEEEVSAGAAGANVATVTLAEIYFQQGLREQALQIYRQLLEREPENESVRKRIEEIEAAKPDGGDRGPGGSDPRRPRPGLKVPKRKK